MRALLVGLGVAVSLAVAYVGCGLSTQGNNVGGFNELDGGPTGTGGTGGTGPTCTGEADCPADTDCATYTCLNKQCELTLSPAGNEIKAGKIQGDCKRKVCAGNGTVSEVNADDDPPASPSPCTTKSCSDGEIVTIIVMDNEPCGQNQYCQGGVCIGCRTTAECKAPPECNTVECTNQECIYTLVTAGTEVGDNSNKSDCMHTICNAGGMQETVPDTTEKPPSDGEDCTQDTCANTGMPSYPPTNEGGDCAPTSDCANASTCVTGKCTPHPKPAGYLSDDDVDGNCKAKYCNGSGGIVVMPDDNDEPQDDPTDCKTPNCVGGVDVPIELADGAACGPNGMLKCCNAVCCAMNTDKCIEDMCCPVAKACNNDTLCCGANQTCSVLGDGGMICSP